MKETHQEMSVPENESGKKINAESVVGLPDLQQAAEHFEVAKTRLLDVSSWNAVAAELAGTFELTDSSGATLNRPAQEGDYFKIDIPGPGTESGDGYDWVIVEEIASLREGNEESCAMTVRPAANPTNETDDTAHFYDAQSTSTFTVSRSGTEVSAAVYDRNVKENNDAEKTTDKIRNAVVGTVGKLFFSKLQWEMWTEAIVRH